MWQTLYTVAYRCLRGRGLAHADAEDLAQETLLAVYRNLDGIEPGKVRAWVRAVARNKHIDFLRRHAHAVSVAAVPDCADSADGPLASVLASAGQEEVRQLLGGLTPGDRRLVELKYLDDLSLEEVAAEVGQSINTVKVGLFRARKRLRSHIENGGTRHGHM